MLSRKVLLILLNQGVGAILGVASLFFIGRYIPKGDFGLVSFALGFVGLVSFVGDMGFSFSHVKRMNEGRDVAECMGTYITARLLLSGLMVLATLLLFYSWENILGYGYADPETPKMAMIMVGYYFFMNINGIFYFTFQAEIKTALQEASMLVMNILRFLGVLAVALIPLGLYWFAGTYVISAAGGALVSFILFMRYRIPVGRPTRAMLRRYTTFALPLVVSSSIAVMAANVDRVMIQLFWTAADVADYSMAQRITTLIIGLSAALGAIIFPAIANAKKDDNISAVRDITRNSERFTSLMIMPAIIFLVLFPWEVLHIIGDFYLSATRILQIQAIYAYLAVIFGIYIFQLNGLGKPGLAAKIAVFVSVLNIVLNTILIPPQIYGYKLLGMGAEGAALSTLISKAIGLVIIQFYSMRVTSARPSSYFLKHLQAALLAGVVVLSLSLYIPPVRIFILAPYFILLAGIYAGILYLFKELTRADIDFLLKTLKPGAMGTYIVDEMKSKRGGSE